MNKKNDEASIGGELVRRLERFTKTLENTTDIHKRFTCKTIKLNLKPHEYPPELVKETRELLHASQAIFAQFLGVSLSAVRDWEQGLKSPGGAARRIMDEIRGNPQYFLNRLKELSTPVGAE
jgi:putative transcriptional regulator